MSLISSEYYNRDVSWLRFNHRVLQEAADERNPLYERIKFLAIFSSNLDEFFKVRVSSIRQIKQLDKKLRKKLITKPNRLLRKIKKEVNLQQEEFGKIFRNQIIPGLEKEGISLIDYTRFSEAQQQFATEYYTKELASKLALDCKISEGEDIFIENEQLYLASTHEGQLIVFKMPSNTPRFVVFPSENDTYSITFIDDILKHNFKEAYPENTFYSIKVSRDAELDTTIQEKEIRFPTDARLYGRARQRLVKAAKKRGIALRQNYNRKSKQLLAQQKFVQEL